MRGVVYCLIGALLLSPAQVRALDVGSDGSDGTLNPSSNVNIDLDLAVTGSWNSPGNGSGVYDPDRWAVVFKYSSVNIASGRTVSFTNHPSGAPVIWLVQGNVTIAGTINIKGSNYDNTGAFAAGGPGGFRGGAAYLTTSQGSAGFGPGGGLYNPGGNPGNNGGGGGYGTAGAGTGGGSTYGNPRVLPLIGGSGGAGHGGYPWGGGAGGGAILIASGGTLTVSGSVDATGGSGSASGPYYSGGGSGGGIRLIGDTITGAASGLIASGGGPTNGAGGAGRIRIEGNTVSLTGSSTPAYTMLAPLENSGTLVVVWPPAGSPSLRVLTVAGQTVPADPRARFVTPGDVVINTSGNVEAIVEATSMPITWTVKVRVNLRNGDESIVTATRVDGDSVSSRWSATLPAFPQSDFVAIQARASQ